VSFQVVIPSARARNLISCVQAVLANEPQMSPSDVIVVDDGARAEAETALPGVRWITGIKPFIFARNVNLGIRAADGDVFLLNDDARLVTPHGFSRLAARARCEAKLGLCSAAIHGIVGNRNQLARPGEGVRFEAAELAFVCVFLSLEVRKIVGMLDERFSGYGFEDNDYCRRVLATGLRLGIWDGCVVDHAEGLSSSFRSRSDLMTLIRLNQRLYEEKWNAMEASGAGSVDLLYLACNRIEFTVETFSTLLASTDWDRVRTLFICDDGSTDGTREWLREQQQLVPSRTEFLATNFGSPVTAMVHFIRRAQAPMLAKLDNDTMMPPGWLAESLKVMEQHPELQLLGIEAMYPTDDFGAAERSYVPAKFISGLGLYRRKAFERSQPTTYQKWFGLEEWQMAHGSSLIRGWIKPALPIFLLDRIPFEPWVSHSDRYITAGIQRSWPRYDPACPLWHWRWPLAAEERFAPPRPDPGSCRTIVATASVGSTAGTIGVSLTDAPTIYGMLRIKNESPHIAQVIARLLGLCQQIIILDDHSSDDTVVICRSFGDRVAVINSPFTGLDEARDKNFLLEKLITLRPDWVLWIDGDEVLERRGPERIRAAVKNGVAVSAYSLRISYIWDDHDHVRIDGIFGRFTRPSLFRLHGQPLNALHFQKTTSGGSLHCGNVPCGLTGYQKNLDVRLKHLGYRSRHQRESKYEWYNSVDPDNTLEDNYRHLIEAPGARHAPGPARLVPWVE
jgi:GT2 family glycosyltransferase